MAKDSVHLLHDKATVHYFNDKIIVYSCFGKKSTVPCSLVLVGRKLLFILLQVGFFKKRSQERLASIF